MLPFLLPARSVVLLGDPTQAPGATILLLHEARVEVRLVVAAAHGLQTRGTDTPTPAPLEDRQAPRHGDLARKICQTNNDLWFFVHMPLALSLSKDGSVKFVPSRCEDLSKLGENYNQFLQLYPLPMLDTEQSIHADTDLMGNIEKNIKLKSGDNT